MARMLKVVNLSSHEGEDFVVDGMLLEPGDDCVIANVSDNGRLIQVVPSIPSDEPQPLQNDTGKQVAPKMDITLVEV